jgi:pyruvate dehydrogenase E2 component (dihydrolipoamide acetyltransferase)
MAREVIMPKLGQTMEEGAILEWYKQEGDRVRRGEPLFQLESDKAALDAEAPGSGTLLKILRAAGDTVPVLEVVALIGSADEDVSAYVPGGAPAPVAVEETPAGAQGQSARPVELQAAEAPSPTPSGRIVASPRARKRAVEEGVVLAMVAGTGPNGRIKEADVLAWLDAQPAATPVARKMAAEAGLDLATLAVEGRIRAEDVERALAQPAAASAPTPAPVAPAATPVPVTVGLTGLRGIIAQRMAQSHVTTAPVTLTAEADATALVALREELKAALAGELGFNVGYNDLLVIICAKALVEFPYMNARLVEADGGSQIVQLPEVHVGVAVDAERGLLVPVIRDADAKGLKGAAIALRELVARAREGKSLPDDLTGGTFTITNLGMMGVDGFTPIINYPETAILGVGRIKERPAVVDGQIVARAMVWLSLTFDHRLVDGAPAARFMQRVVQLVEKPALLLA